MFLIDNLNPVNKQNSSYLKQSSSLFYSKFLNENQNKNIILMLHRYTNSPFKNTIIVFNSAGRPIEQDYTHEGKTWSMKKEIN